MYLKFFRINTKHANEWDEHNLSQNCRGTGNVKFKNNNDQNLSICEA